MGVFLIVRCGAVDDRKISLKFMGFSDKQLLLHSFTQQSAWYTFYDWHNETHYHQMDSASVNRKSVYMASVFVFDRQLSNIYPFNQNGWERVRKDEWVRERSRFAALLVDKFSMFCDVWSGFNWIFHIHSRRLSTAQCFFFHLGRCVVLSFHLIHSLWILFSTSPDAAHIMDFVFFLILVYCYYRIDSKMKIYTIKYTVAIEWMSFNLTARTLSICIIFFLFPS